MSVSATTGISGDVGDMDIEDQTSDSASEVPSSDCLSINISQNMATFSVVAGDGDINDRKRELESDDENIPHTSKAKRARKCNCLNLLNVKIDKLSTNQERIMVMLQKVIDDTVPLSRRMDELELKISSIRVNAGGPLPVVMTDPSLAPAQVVTAPGKSTGDVLPADDPDMVEYLELLNRKK